MGSFQFGVFSFQGFSQNARENEFGQYRQKKISEGWVLDWMKGKWEPITYDSKPTFVY